jgi:hypothetical protein
MNEALRTPNSPRRRDNTSGFTGATRRTDGKKWVASLRFRGQSRHLGSFDSAEAAARAYEQAFRAFRSKTATLLLCSLLVLLSGCGNGPNPPIPEPTTPSSLYPQPTPP